MHHRQLILGLLFWLSAVGGTVVWSRSGFSPELQKPSAWSFSSEIGEWLADRRSELNAVCSEPIPLAIGDPVLQQNPDGSFVQVGWVADNYGLSPDNLFTQRARIVVYNSALADFPNGVQLRYQQTPESLNWVVKTIIPPERQQQIVDLIAADWKRHQEVILANLTPVIQEGIQRTLDAMEAELPATIERHRRQFAMLGDRYRREIMQQQLQPLVRDHLLPIVQEELRPLLNEIGQSLWNRVSVWSFTWRYLYDVSPLPQKNAVRQEFDRFLEAEAIPELQRHTPQFVEVTERIIARLSRDPTVSDTIRRSLRLVASDPELHAIVWSILREAVLKNQVLRQSLEDYLNSPQTRELLQLTSARFEPTAREIGDLIIGSRDVGITPEFARILRLQILLKDRHWLILEPSSPGASAHADSSSGTAVDEVVIQRAGEFMLFPLTFEGSAWSPLTPVE